MLEFYSLKYFFFKFSSIPRAFRFLELFLPLLLCFYQHFFQNFILRAAPQQKIRKPIAKLLPSHEMQYIPAKKKNDPGRCFHCLFYLHPMGSTNSDFYQNRGFYSVMCVVESRMFRSLFVANIVPVS